MFCKNLVAVFLFCGVAVMGASVSNNASSMTNSSESLHGNSTMTPKLIALSLNPTALNDSDIKSSNVSASNNKTEKLMAPGGVEVVLKNLNGSLNSTEIDVNKMQDKALNSTDTKSSNVTSHQVGRAVNLVAENSTLISRNETKSDNSSDSIEAKLEAANSTTSSNSSSKIVERSVDDKDTIAENATKTGLNGTSSAKMNTSTSVSSSRNDSNLKQANATDEDNTTTDRPVQLLKANATLLDKGNSSIRILRRRETELVADDADTKETTKKPEEQTGKDSDKEDDKEDDDKASDDSGKDDEEDELDE